MESKEEGLKRTRSSNEDLARQALVDAADQGDWLLSQSRKDWHISRVLGRSEHFLTLLEYQRGGPIEEERSLRDVERFAPFRCRALKMGDPPDLSQPSVDAVLPTNVSFPKEVKLAFAQSCAEFSDLTLRAKPDSIEFPCTRDMVKRHSAPLASALSATKDMKVLHLLYSSDLLYLTRLFMECKAMSMNPDHMKPMMEAVSSQPALLPDLMHLAADLQMKGLLDFCASWTTSTADAKMEIALLVAMWKKARLHRLDELTRHCSSRLARRRKELLVYLEQLLKAEDRGLLALATVLP